MIGALPLGGGAAAKGSALIQKQEKTAVLPAVAAERAAGSPLAALGEEKNGSPS